MWSFYSYIFLFQKSRESESGSDSGDSDQTVVEEGAARSSRESSQEKSPAAPDNYNVEVVCENNQRFYADHVICTLPLGVLKHKANDLFKPLLPEYKMEAIERLLFGTVDKILLEYERCRIKTLF